MENRHVQAVNTVEYSGEQQYPSPTVVLGPRVQPSEHLEAKVDLMVEQFQQMSSLMQAQMSMMERLQNEIYKKKSITPEAAPQTTSEDAEKQDFKTQRMPILTLGDFNGVKYDGSPDKFLSWDETIRDKLLINRASHCIRDESYQGRDFHGKRIVAGPYLNDLIRDGTDLQSVIGGYLIESLIGTIRASIKTLQRDREKNPLDGRYTLTAYEIYAHVKKEAKPVLAYEMRQQIDHLFRTEKLPPRADRVLTDAYIHEKKSQWEMLNETGGGKDVISEHSLVAQILSGMMEHHGQAYRVLKEKAMTNEGEYIFTNFLCGLDSQFPRDYSYSKQGVNQGVYITNNRPLCEICKKHHGNSQCWHDPNQFCGKCGEKGHHRERCAQEKQGTTKMDVKNEQDKAYILLGKEKEAELLASAKDRISLLGAHSTSIGSIGPSPYAPIPKSQPPKEVQLQHVKVILPPD